MRDLKRKKDKDKVAAVLMLCFCLIALTSIFTIKASIDKISNSAKDIPVTNDTAVNEDQSNIDENETKLEKETKETSSKVPTVDSENKNSTNSTYISPISAKDAALSKKYSMNMIIYNETLDQYMVHPGIDITAASGSNVRAIFQGTITDIFVDDAYGQTIVINHGDGLTARYCNLSTDSIVEKGDTVKKGQVIGCIGQTALYESLEPAHLHLEIMKNAKLTDPSKFINND